MAQEHLVIPKVFYPWIKGPYNETIDRIQAETGARVNIPPPSANSEVIVVTGEKDGVHKAAAYIKQIYEDKVRDPVYFMLYDYGTKTLPFSES